MVTTLRWRCFCGGAQEPPGGSKCRWSLANDRWPSLIAPQIGRYEFTVAGWVDAFLTWRRDMKKRVEAAQDTHVDYLIGADSWSRPPRVHPPHRPMQHGY